MISTNQFTSSGSYLGAEQYVLQDFAGTNGHLYKGGASTVTTLRWSNAYSSVEEVSAPGAGGAYALSYTGNGIAVTFNPTTGTAHSYSVSLGAIDAGTATGYKAPQPNSAWSLDAGDGRITDATYANGKLYAVFQVNTGTSGSPAPTVHWVELDTTKLGTSGALVAPGNLTLAGAVTFNPSIAVDGNGDVPINFTASGSALYATDYFAVMPAGTAGFSAPVAYQTSANTAYTQGSNYVARWGDYSSAAADPNNPAGFWVSNEYATSASSWGTALDQVTLGTGTGTLAFLAPTGTSTTTSGSPTTLVAAPTGDIPTQNMSLADLLGSVNPMDLLNIPTGDLFDVKSLGSSTASTAADLPFSAGSLWPTPSDHGPTGGLILHA